MIFATPRMPGVGRFARRDTGRHWRAKQSEAHPPVWGWRESARRTAAWDAGVSDVLLDVGFGFAKTADDNIKLLKHHKAFKKLGVPMVLGVSRKSTIGKMLGGLPAEERMIGSISAAIYGAIHGAKIIRTHDVKETKQAFMVIEGLS